MFTMEMGDPEKMTKKEKDYLNKFLGKVAMDLEPKTHCCECTHGEHYQPHMIHIQYPKCNCDPKNYILKRNYGD